MEHIMKTPALWISALVIGASVAATGALAVDNITSRDTPYLAAVRAKIEAKDYKAALFLHVAFSKRAAYSAALAYMQVFGVPGQLLPLAIALELGGGLLILCGYHTRAAALLLAGFCVATAVLFHTKFGDRNQLLHFEKDLAIAGGLLVLFAHGGGAWALDR